MGALKFYLYLKYYRNECVASTNFVQPAMKDNFVAIKRQVNECSLYKHVHVNALEIYLHHYGLKYRIESSSCLPWQ